MYEILPWMQCLIERTILTTTCLASPATVGDEVIQVEAVNWFSRNDTIVIGDDIRVIASINAEDHLLTLTAPLEHSSETGTAVQKLRAVNPPHIHIGDFSGATSLPRIHITGTSERTEPLTIGAFADIHQVQFTMLAEEDNQSDSHQEMMQLTRELRNILLVHRQFWLNARWMYNAIADVDYGTYVKTSATLAASQLTFTMYEEYYAQNVASTPCGEPPSMPFYESSVPCTAVANVDMVYQITASDCSIFCDASENGPFDVYLPQATIVKDHPFLIKKMDDSANAITILPHGDDRVENETSLVLDTPGQKVVLVYRGGYADILPPTPNWEIIEQAVEYEAVSF